jgi:O-antigen/teichoic acid export membrane protein
MKVSLVYLAALAGWGIEGVMAGFIAGTILPCLVALAFLFRIPGGEAPPADGARIWSRLIRLSAPLAVSGASVMIYTIQDKLMLKYFHTAADVGWYSNARSMSEVALFPTFALTMVLRPALAGAFARGDRGECAAIVNRSIRLSFVYAMAVVVVLACFAEPIVVGLFGADFEPSAALLVLFLPFIVIRCIGVVVLPGLIAADRAGTYAKLTLLGAAVNFILNAILIPPLRSSGAIIATLASYIPMEVIGLIALSRVMPGFWRRADVLAMLLAAAPAAALVLLVRLFVPLPASLLPAIVEGAVLALVFAAALFPLRILSWGEVTGAARRIANSFLTRAPK